MWSTWRPRREARALLMGSIWPSSILYVIEEQKIGVSKTQEQIGLFQKVENLLYPIWKCESTLDGVHLTVFPIYSWLVNENWVSKNTNVNRPFWNGRKSILFRWVGPSILLKFYYNYNQDVPIKKTSKMCTVSQNGIQNCQRPLD